MNIRNILEVQSSQVLIYRLARKLQDHFLFPGTEAIYLFGAGPTDSPIIFPRKSRMINA